MHIQSTNQATQRRANLPINQILNGDCIDLMRQLRSANVDFILTAPPYLVNYRDPADRSIQNDNSAEWLKPAFTEAYRVLKPNAFMFAFYGWTKVDLFMDAWRSAGFRVAGHLVFRKQYASKSCFLRYRHEQAYLLAKGRPALSRNPIADVIGMPYSGNALHPRQKPVQALLALIEAFSQPGDLVLNPFSGSGSTLEHFSCRCTSTGNGHPSNMVAGDHGVSVAFPERKSTSRESPPGHSNRRNAVEHYHCYFIAESQ